MPGVTLLSAGSSTKKGDIGPRRLRRAQRRFQRPGTGIRRCRDSNPGAGNLGVGSVTRSLMRDPAPRAGLLRIRAGGRRPVSARLGPPDPSDVAARLQRAERSEPRDGRRMVAMGDPWRNRPDVAESVTGSCASPRAMAGTARPSLVRVSRPDLSTEPAPLRTHFRSARHRTGSRGPAPCRVTPQRPAERS